MSIQLVKLKFYQIIILILILSVNASSTTIQEEFVKSSTSVRQLGMGGAATAVADDLSATFYNPAGLAKAGAPGYSFGNIDTNKEIIDENHYYAYNLGSLGYFGYDKKLSNGSKAKADMVGFGVRSGMGISYGLTYKNILLDDTTKECRGYSMDAGLLINVSPQFTIGILGQDAVSDNRLEVPGSIRLGGAYKPFEEWLLIAADTEISRQGPGDFTHYGIEGKVVDGFKLRAGIDQGNTTFGASLSLPIITVHYAGMLNKDANSGTVQMIGGEMSFFERPHRPMSIIRPKEFALVDIGGNIVGGLGDFSIFGGGKVGADSIIAHIKDATKDPYIDGIILRIRGFDGGLGSFAIVQEIRSELIKAKEKGKKIVAYMEEGTLGDEYYLASVADKVIAPPAATVGGIGKSINIIKIKGLLEKYGIESQVIAKGKYKTTFNMFSSELTKQQKLMVQGILADLYRQMVTDIGSSRKDRISMAKLKEISDGSIFSSAKAKELGLIDEVGYMIDAKKAAADLYDSKGEIAVIEKNDLIRESEEDFLFAFPNKIAVIEIDGDIVTGKSGQNIIFGGHATGADVVCDQIRKAAGDWQVKAIIVRINSGGGSAVASGQIYSELKRAREKGKTIVASMGDIGASGGYFIASAADKIVADPGTITGSIGVIERDIFNYSGLLKMLDIKADTIKEGKHSDMFSGLRKLSTEEVRSLSIYMEETYRDFIRSVADGRGMTTSEVASLAEGRVYTGSQAKNVKLVDELGNFTDSVHLAADMTNIMGEPKLIYYREENFMFLLGSNAVKMLGLGDGIFPDQGLGLAEYKMNM
jgi:protease-4